MKRIGKTAEAAFLLGIILCALGVSLSARSGFGVSMVVAPAYVLHVKTETVFPWFTFGIAEYVLQGVLVLALSLGLRRLKGKYLLSFATAVLYGTALDLWRALVGTGVAETLGGQIAFMVAGALVTALSIALLLRTYLPQQAYELVVKEISDTFRFPVGRVKWVYDALSLALAIVLMLCLFGRFDLSLVGVGTLILTVINTPLIGLFGKLLDRFFDFTPAFEGFHTHFRERFD